MRVPHHPVTLRIPPLPAIMRTLRHRKDHTILRRLAVLTLRTRATQVLRLFPIRVIPSCAFQFIIISIVLHAMFCCFLSVSTGAVFITRQICRSSSNILSSSLPRPAHAALTLTFRTETFIPVLVLVWLSVFKLGTYTGQAGRWRAKTRIATYCYSRTIKCVSFAGDYVDTCTLFYV